MRHSIFELIEQNTDLTLDAQRIIRLFSKEKTISISSLYSSFEVTVEDFLKDYAFDEWEGRGHVTDVSEFLQLTGYRKMASYEHFTLDDFVTLAEILINLWHITNKSRTGFYGLKMSNNFFLIEKIIVETLNTCNHEIILDQSHNRYIIVEAKPEVTAAAEIAEKSLAFEILRYNHRILKGNLQEKKRILLAMGSDIEKKRKDLHKLNSPVEDPIFMMLNNMGIRHSNQHNDEVVASLSKNELEKWYDELYQMMLLAELELDNVKRMEEFKNELKPKLVF